MTLFPPSPASGPFRDDDTLKLYEDAPCGLLSTLPDGTIIRINATLLDWTGYARDELVGKLRFQQLLPVAGKVFHDTHMAPLLAMQGCARELAFELVCSNGARLPVLLNAVLVRDEGGKPLAVRMAILEARQRRTYEEELRVEKRRALAAEEALRELTATLEMRVAERTQERDRIWRLSRDMLAVATFDGHFISFNPAFTEVLGWTNDDMPAISLADLAHPDHAAMLRDALATLSRCEPLRLELQTRHKDGSYRWLSWNVTPEDGRLYAVGRDITEDRDRAEALRLAEDALRHAQKMEAVGELTGGVAHDFNNILQVIAGNLELMRLDPGGKRRPGPMLHTAIAAVERGATIASQLLAFARRQPLEPVASRLDTLLHDMNDLLRRVMGEDIEIEVVAGAGLWTVMVDRNQFENVVLNLAINARDAMEGNGRFTLELGNALLGDDDAEAHAEAAVGEYVMLAVTDTGSGMEPEIAERAFDPFFTTKEHGTGLGLSMAYGFVKQSGGYIKVRSRPGQGTTFRIYLPRVHQGAEEVPDIRRQAVVGGNETILVVEDDAAVRATAVELLASLGYSVLKAADGRSALGIIESGAHIDLLFTDVAMPGPVSCTEVARRAKTHDPAIEVLFTSAYTRNAIVHGGRLDPGVQFIAKPYGRDDLARKIRHVLAGRRQVQALRSETPVAERGAPQESAVNAAGDAENMTSTPAAAQTLSILVVEDNTDAREALCELLKLLGHRANGADSPSSALQQLQAGQVDILLTDYSLPEMSGLELARRALDAQPRLRIIFTSGYGDIDTGGLPSASLPKPFTLHQVQAALSHVAAGHSSH